MNNHYGGIWQSSGVTLFVGPDLIAALKLKTLLIWCFSFSNRSKIEVTKVSGEQTWNFDEHLVFSGAATILRRRNWNSKHCQMHNNSESRVISQFIIRSVKFVNDVDFAASPLVTQPLFFYITCNDLCDINRGCKRKWKVSWLWEMMILGKVTPATKVAMERR